MNTKTITRKEYMAGSSAKHHDFYAQFVTASTMRFVSGSLTVEQIKKAIESGDEHLNKIAIPFNNMGSGGSWWWDGAPVNEALVRELGENMSPSTHTCVGKAAARILIEESKAA
jgi:hypothetical protein